MSKHPTPRREAKIREVLARRQKDLTLIVDNVWDPHNVSAILRSCDAFGVLTVHLYYTDEQFPYLGKKSSASGRKWLGRRRHSDGRAMVDELSGRGFRLIRSGFSETARPLTEFDLTQPTAFILSNEHRGVSPELVELAPEELYIPMQGMIPSFNVSVAAALMLYEAWRQRSAKGMYDAPSLSSDELEEIAGHWLMK
ncbi:MAG: TrmH family RNA methyltransferase [Desulfovibrionaceae bacterium]